MNNKELYMQKLFKLWPSLKFIIPYRIDWVMFNDEFKALILTWFRFQRERESHKV